MTEAATTDSWGVSLPLGPAWFKLPVAPDADHTEVQAQVDARISREPRLAERRPELVDMVSHFTKDARERGAVAAGLLWALDNLDGVVVATLYCAVCERTTGDSVDQYREALQAQLATKHPNDRTKRKIEMRDLEAGKALRVRVMSDAEAIGEEEDQSVRQSVVLLDTAQYWVPLARQPVTLLFTFATPNLAGAEHLVEQFDDILQRMAIRQ